MSVALAAEDTAADTTAAQPPPPHNAHGWHQGGPWHVLSQLNLNAAQKQQVEDVLTAARPQMQSLRPTDPNYASVASLVSQTHGTLSAQSMAQQSDLRAQVFKLLTPEQQTQFVALEEQSHADRGQR